MKCLGNPLEGVFRFGEVFARGRLDRVTLVGRERLQVTIVALLRRVGWLEGGFVLVDVKVRLSWWFFLN